MFEASANADISFAPVVAKNTFCEDCPRSTAALQGCLGRNRVGEISAKKVPGIGLSENGAQPTQGLNLNSAPGADFLSVAIFFSVRSFTNC